MLCVTFDRGLASKLTSGAGLLKNLKIVISSPQSMLETPNYHHFLPMIVSFILCHLFLSMTIMTVMTVYLFWSYILSLRHCDDNQRYIDGTSDATADQAVPRG